MITRPYKFMFGLVLIALGVGLICVMLQVGGGSTINIAVTLAILLAGVLLGGESIQSPNAPPRRVEGHNFSEKTKSNFNAAIEESLSKKAET